MQKTLFFVTRMPDGLEKFIIRHAGRPKTYSLRAPKGIPEPGQQIAVWVQRHEKNPDHPNVRTISVRIYKHFFLQNNFVQPTAKSIFTYLKDVEKINGSFGCGYYIKFRSFMLANLASSNEIKQIFKKQKRPA